jgi:hypothetical protein
MKNIAKPIIAPAIPKQIATSFAYDTPRLRSHMAPKNPKRHAKNKTGSERFVRLSIETIAPPTGFFGSQADSLP